MKVVLALFPTDVIGPRVVIAGEESDGIVPEGETPLNADTLNGRRSRLERDRNAKGCGVGSIGSGTAVGDFARVAKAEIVDEPGRENVSFVRQEVLRGDRKSTVRVRDKLQRIKNGRLCEAIEFVTATQFVVLPEGVIDAAHDGIKVLGVGL